MVSTWSDGHPLPSRLPTDDPAPMALFYAIQIADGLAALHDSDLGHARLHLDNVLVNDRDVVSLVGLGTDLALGQRQLPDVPRPVIDAATLPSEKATRIADQFALAVLVTRLLGARVRDAGRRYPLVQLPADLEKATHLLSRPDLHPGTMPDVRAEPTTRRFERAHGRARALAAARKRGVERARTAC